jgi:Zn-dependent protease with chaperone function
MKAHQAVRFWPMSPANLSRLLRLLMMLYVPFLVLLALSMIGIVVGAIILTVMAPSLLCAWLVPLVALLILTLVQFAQATQFMLRAREPDRDESELRLSRKKLQGLYDLVHKVAQDRGLRVPDEIRLAAETVAHVYEDRKGKEILVIGGFAIASFTQETLAGIIAHELGHFAAGDTRLGRKARGRQMFMALLDDHLSGRLSSFFNPLVWMVRAYHWLYFSVWAANSRNQEIQADKQEVKQAGKDRAAAALLYTTVLARMPWLRLSDIAGWNLCRAGATSDDH